MKTWNGQPTTLIAIPFCCLSSLFYPVLCFATVRSVLSATAVWREWIMGKIQHFIVSLHCMCIKWSSEMTTRNMYTTTTSLCPFKNFTFSILDIHKRGSSAEDISTPQKTALKRLPFDSTDIAYCYTNIEPKNTAIYSQPSPLKSFCSRDINLSRLNCYNTPFSGMNVIICRAANE